MWILLFFLLTVAPAFGQEVTLTWNDNSDNEETFVAEMASCETCTFAWVGAVSMNQTIFIAKSLPVGATRCFRVYAHNIVGNSGYSNTACTTVKALPGSDEVLTLTWTPIPDPPSALALWYKFDGNASDSSGNNRTGVAAGAATYGVGKFNQALSLSGDGRVRTPYVDSLTVRTFMAWTKRTGPGGNNMGRIYEKRQGGPEVEVLYNDEADPTKKRYRFLVTWSGEIGSWSINQPPLNEWHHIAVVYDASSPANKPLIYLDGVAQVVSQDKAPNGNLLTNSDAYIIGNRGAADRGWSGQLDDARLYTRALTPAEIQTNMTGQ